MSTNSERHQRATWLKGCAPPGGADYEGSVLGSHTQREISPLGAGESHVGNQPGGAICQIGYSKLQVSGDDLVLETHHRNNPAQNSSADRRDQVMGPGARCRGIYILEKVGGGSAATPSAVMVINWHKAEATTDQVAAVSRGCPVEHQSSPDL
ncbi:hypothetical protein NDU88_006324 [Pleurodeles waltl]|uniref:Uncharacterized protein n=1 Tax=Pleurodeles waltl TaxID=8319 RepID=A0AAV7WEE1_PLEWA|nr:hypothetical protein NDU88_006324 [Pleurodeles waltl]